MHCFNSLECACVCVSACVISPSRLTGNEPLSILPLSSIPEENVGRAHYKLCDRLKLEKKQRRMCRRDPGVAETLMEAISMSAMECQYQFRFERWNCTLEGRHRANILKRGRSDKSNHILCTSRQTLSCCKIRFSIFWVVTAASLLFWIPKAKLGISLCLIRHSSVCLCRI